MAYIVPAGSWWHYSLETLSPIVADLGCGLLNKDNELRPPYDPHGPALRGPRLS